MTHCPNESFNLVLISSAIITCNEPLSYTPTRSHFSHQQRFEQTLKTIESIRKKIPDSFIVLVEGTQIPMNMFNELNSKVNYIHPAYLIPEVYQNINGPYKGLGEMSSILSYLQSDHYKEHEVKFQTISKISGRYRIRDDFEWVMDDNRIVCRINYNCPDHPSRIHMSTIFYTVGKNLKEKYIEIAKECCMNQELNSGIALEHVFPLCILSKKIGLYEKNIMQVEGEYGPWGGYVYN